MSDFIVPISGLPSISSITEVGKAKGASGVTGVEGVDGLPFMDYLSDAISSLSQSGENSRTSTYNLALGGSDDLHTGAIDSLKYSTAVSYTSGLASAAIRAYKEIIQMQI